MALKKYEIDAIVETIVEKLGEYNSKIHLPSEEELNILFFKEVPVAERISAILSDIKNLERRSDELRKEAINLIREHYNNPNRYIYSPDGELTPIRNKFIEEYKLKVGFKPINTSTISNLVILNQNKDLDEIIKIVCNKLNI